MRFCAMITSVVLLCGVVSPASASGTIDIQTTPAGNVMVIDVTVVDNGGAGGCNNSFTLQRRLIPGCATVDIATWARQPGTTATHRCFDAPVYPSRAYEYEVLSCAGFTWAFDCGWGLPVVATATTAPGPAYLGQGRLENGITFYGCDGLCATRDVLRMPADGLQYVGTGTEVALYGGFFASCQNGWLLDVSQVVPSSCALSVDPVTWTGAKTLFR